MFRKYYGQCIKCVKGVTRVIVVKAQLCSQHNQEKKNESKPPKPPKQKIIKKKKLRYGQCRLCPPDTIKYLPVKYFCQLHNELNKKEAKSKRIVKLVNKSEDRKSHPKLKKILWEIFSEYIRLRDSKDGIFTCISCHKIQSASGGNLQAGHYYKSETYPAHRYNPLNSNGQCKSCNLFKEGNRQGYEIGMIKKYGQRVVDDLKLSCHNKIRLGRFELELLIKEFTEKLNKLKESL